MAEPGEIIIIKAVAGGVKYTPNWFLHNDESGRRNCSVEIIPIPPFFKGLQVSIHIVLEGPACCGSMSWFTRATLLSVVTISSKSGQDMLKPCEKEVTRTDPFLGTVQK